MVVDKSRDYGHIVVLFLLRSVTDGRVDVKVAADHIKVGSLLFPHVELLPVDKADVLLDDGRVVELLATDNKTKEGVVWSVSCTIRGMGKGETHYKNSIVITLCFSRDQESPVIRRTTGIVVLLWLERRIQYQRCLQPQCEKQGKLAYACVTTKLVSCVRLSSIQYKLVKPASS